MIRRLLDLIHIHRWGRWRLCQLVDVINGRPWSATGQVRQCVDPRCRYQKIKKLGW